MGVEMGGAGEGSNHVYCMEKVLTKIFLVLILVH